MSTGRLLSVSLRWVAVSFTLAFLILGLFLLLHSIHDIPQQLRLIPFEITRSLQQVVIGCILLAGALLLGAVAKWWDSPSDHRIFGALAAASPFIPAIAAVITLAAYIGAPGSRPVNAGWVAVLAGILAALYSWLLLSLLYQRFASADSANPRVYHQIYARWDELARQLDALNFSCADPFTNIAYAEALAHKNFIAEELGLRESGEASTGFRWTTATGYLNLWNRLHRAEEALILLKPTPFVVSEAHYDGWLLRHSVMNNASELLERLESAIEVLGAKSPDPHGGLQGEEQLAVGTLKGQEARAIIHGVRRSINEYRDYRQAGLIRARNRVIRTGTFTALWAYIFFSLAILAGVPENAIIAATAFYLVGACIGLFNQLLSEASTESNIEDYGLTSSRLLHIPLFSGIAALGGVVLIPMLINAVKPDVMAPNTLVQERLILVQERPITEAVPRAPAPNEVHRTQVVPQAMRSSLSEEGVMRKLRDIFDIERYPFGLVIAAVFGLTPRLLTDRLKQQTDRYTEELNATRAGSSSRRGNE